MIVAKKKFLHCIPPITAVNDAYNCSPEVNHSYSSSSLLMANTSIKLGIFFMQLPNPLPD